MSTIPNKEGDLPVAGLETIVDKFRLESQYLDAREKELEETKSTFRSEAKRILRESAPGVQRVAFMGTKGTGAVLVSVLDVEAKSNRTLVKPDLVANALNLGLDLGGMVETSVTYELSGAWVEWLEKTVLSQATGELPEGLTKKEQTRLTQEAVQKLRELEAAGEGTVGQAATLVLDSGLKKASINVR